MIGFRTARDASAAWNVAKTAVQIIGFWGLFLFVLPPWIAARAAALGLPTWPSPAGRLAGAVLFIAASALGLTSGLTMAIRGGGTPLPFDTARRFVASGPYAWVRNPMAVAGLSQGIGVALWLGSLAVALYVVTGGVLWHVAVRPAEEADLARRFGRDYLDYRERVSLWWPTRSHRGGEYNRDSAGRGR